MMNISKRRISRSLLWQCLCMALLVCGCHQQVTNAIVVNAPKISASKPVIHVVAKSETLYSIAFNNSMDYRQLAKMNCLKPPYVLHVGLQLSLQRWVPCAKGSKIKSKKWLPKQQLNVVSMVPDDTLEALNKKDFFTPIVVQQPINKSEWKWPVRGPLLARFSASHFGQNGIDIGGKLNTPIKACRDGMVVYSGQGLKSYGKLIIIKHDESDLSAYAHNNQLLVKEGQAVKGGQTIANMGFTGTDRVKLHFEIRHHGKAVNPLLYLPN